MCSLPAFPKSLIANGVLEGPPFPKSEGGTPPLKGDPIRGVPPHTWVHPYIFGQGTDSVVRVLYTTLLHAWPAQVLLYYPRATPKRYSPMQDSDTLPYAASATLNVAHSTALTHD